MKEFHVTAKDIADFIVNKIKKEYQISDIVSISWEIEYGLFNGAKARIADNTCQIIPENKPSEQQAELPVKVNYVPVNIGQPEKRKRRRRITRQDKAEIKALYLKNPNVIYIALKTGFSPTTVKRTLKSVPEYRNRKRTHKILFPEKLREIKALLQIENNILEVALAVGYSEQTIKRIIAGDYDYLLEQ